MIEVNKPCHQNFSVIFFLISCTRLNKCMWFEDTNVTLPFFFLLIYAYRSIEFDEFLEFIIARQGDGRDVHNEIVQVCKRLGMIYCLQLF